MGPGIQSLCRCVRGSIMALILLTNTIAAFLFILPGIKASAVHNHHPVEAPCFHTCAHSVDPFGCSLDTQNHWQCPADQVCEIIANHHQVSMQCRHAQECYHDEEPCLQLPEPHEHKECIFCCHDRSCVQDVASRQTSAPSVNQARHSCYNPDCHHDDHLDVCAQGTYQCGANEYCNLHVMHGSVFMTCQDLNGHAHQDCEARALRNHVDCDYYNPRANCQYCCQDDQCIQDLVSAASSVVPTPGKNSCFDLNCDHHTHLDYCVSGNWACGPGEFCKTDVHGNGDVHMHCQHLDHELAKCYEEAAHNAPECNDPVLFGMGHNCRFCCTDAYCMRAFVGNTTASTTTTPVPTTPVPTTPAPTTQVLTTPAPTTAAATTVASTVSPTTQAATSTAGPASTASTASQTTTPVVTTTAAPISTTEDPCKDHYKGDCAVDFGGLCSNINVQTMCPKTCGVCQQSATPPACMDVHHGNCSRDFTPDQCHTSQIVADVCRQTCGLCSGSPASPVAARSVELNPSDNPGQCVQCGDYENGVPCSSLELLSDSPTPCTHPAHNLCMTDISVDKNRQMAIYKRCVDAHACLNDWYHSTSDNDACVNLDPTTFNSDLTCHFCCQGNGCNKEAVPDLDLLWRPQ